MKHVVIQVPAIHAADCRCAACRGGPSGPARRAAPRGLSARRIWNELCIIAAIAAFIAVPGRWLLAALPF